ncbi:MAG: hypothetical protein FWD57_01605 [Polyangiaceae bacterium]|nr:hypothetical protein [Polyangiaceae bacterium]
MPLLAVGSQVGSEVVCGIWLVGSELMPDEMGWLFEFSVVIPDVGSRRDYTQVRGIATVGMMCWFGYLGGDKLGETVGKT